MRKDAIQARKTIEALGYIADEPDSHGHLVFTHPDHPEARVKLSLSPSDCNGHVQAVRAAHKALGLPPPRAAGKRRPATVRAAERARRAGRSAA